MDSYTLPQAVVQGAIAHMNADHQHNLLAYARVLAGADWAETAVLTALDAHGIELRIGGGNGREETHRIDFPQPVADAGALRMALVQLAQQADPPDGVQRTATARVATPKASRYLKALCNHFDRKGSAAYDDHSGTVHFPFGGCYLEAQADALHIRVVAESETMFARVKHVVADHLVRFGAKEELTVDWQVDSG